MFEYTLVGEVVVGDDSLQIEQLLGGMERRRGVVDGESGVGVE